jgi:hypothetical protein
VLDLLLKHSVLFVLELVLSTFLGVLLVFEEVLVLLIQPFLSHLLLLALLTFTLKSSLLCIVNFNIFIIQIGSFFVNLYVFTFQKSLVSLDQLVELFDFLFELFVATIRVFVLIVLQVHALFASKKFL